MTNSYNLVFSFDFRGSAVEFSLVPETSVTNQEHFIYRGKELEAYFSISPTDTDDVLTCRLVNLSNNNELKLSRVFLHSSGVEYNCNTLFKQSVKKMSIGDLRTFLGSNFPATS